MGGRRGLVLGLCGKVLIVGEDRRGYMGGFSEKLLEASPMSHRAMGGRSRLTFCY